MDKREVLPPSVEAPEFPVAPTTEAPVSAVDSTGNFESRATSIEHPARLHQPSAGYRPQLASISLREGVTSLSSVWQQEDNLNQRRECFNQIKSQYQHKKLEDLLI